jgi:hypothetical protein
MLESASSWKEKNVTLKEKLLDAKNQAFFQLCFTSKKHTDIL